MEVRLITDDFSAWDTYVELHPLGSVYHTSLWKKVVENHFKKKTFFLQASENDEIRGVLPLVLNSSKIFGRSIISVPFVNYGGMLYSDHEAEEALLEEADKIRSRENAGSVELRSAKAIHESLPVKTQKVTFYLDLPDDDEVLFKSFKAKLRSQIRRPIKEEMFTRHGREELLDDFYYVFCRNMKQLGTPVYSKELFRSILTYLPDNSFILNIYTKDGKVAGCAFLIGFKERMEIPWASTLREYNRFSPNMLMYWDVLRQAIKGGYKQFDFGRCSRDSGTYKFKKQWGASTEHQLYWYYILPDGAEMPQVNPDNPKYRLVINAWKKLPLCVANTLGPLIVRNLP